MYFRGNKVNAGKKEQMETAVLLYVQVFALI